MKYVKKMIKVGAVAAFWLCVWALLARAVNSPLLLPSPIAVAMRLGELAATATFWATVGRTLFRIALGFLCAIPLGALLAELTCRFRLWRALLSPILTVMQSTPVASFILLLLIWLGRDALPSVIAALMVAPVVWRNLSAGVSGIDPRLLELAKVYRFPPGRRLRRIYFPSLAPYLFAACRSGLGLAWKAGVAAEVLTVPKGTVGQMLYEAKLYLETTDLFVWTVTVILCSLLIETLLIALLGRLEKGGRGK